MSTSTPNTHSADTDVAMVLRWLLGAAVLLGLLIGLDGIVWIALGKPPVIAPQHLAHAWWIEDLRLIEAVFATALVLLALVAMVFAPWLIGNGLIRTWRKVRHAQRA